MISSLRERLRDNVGDARVMGAAIFVLALALRLLHVLDISSLPHFRELVLDAEEYDAMAQRLLSGQWRQASEGMYVHGVLYPLLLALWKGVGLKAVGVRVAQAVLGAACCWLVYRIGRRCTSDTAAVVAGVWAALYWPFIVFGGELLATTLVLLLELTLADLLLRSAAAGTAPEAGSRARAAFAGVLVALLTMTRANAALLAPAVVWWLWRTRGPRQWRPLAEFAVALLVTLSPYLVHNQILQGSPMPFQGGWSFYLGANPDADGTPYVRQGSQWQRLELRAIRAGATEPTDRGAYYTRKALEFIASQPAWFGRLTYAKLRLFWHDHEVPVSADLRTLESHSRLWPLLPPGMGLIVPLALVGLVLGRGLGDAHQRLLAGFVLAWLISGLLFTVCARYRLPATPFLIIWAGSGLVGLADIVRRRHVATAGKAVAAGLVGLLAAYTGVDRDAVDHLRSEWLLAHLRIRQGDYRGAETALQAALRRDPHSADVHNSFGVVHEYLGRPAEAERAYRRALEQEAEFARAWMNLSRLSLRGGRLTDAADALRRVIDLDPRSRVQYEAWYQLGQIRLAQEQHEAALNAFSQALQAKATALAWYGRSVASAGLGKTEDQVRCLEKAVALDPGLAPAQRNLGALHLQIGRYEEAETALRAAAAADPGNGLTYRHLAGLYEQTGRREEARQARAQARRLGAR